MNVSKSTVALSEKREINVHPPSTAKPQSRRSPLHARSQPRTAPGEPKSMDLGNTREKQSTPEVARINNEIAEFLKKNEVERIKLEDLQTSISKLRYNIEKKRKNIREITTMRRKKQVDLSLTNESKYTAAQIKLAQAKIRDREMREEINQLREERMSKIVLLHELAEKKEELKDRIVKTQCDIKGVKEEEGKYREITAKLQEEVGKRIAELKKQYLELDKYAEAHTEKEQEQVWKESGGAVEEKPKQGNIARVLINNTAVKMVHPTANNDEDKKKLKFLAAFSAPTRAPSKEKGVKKALDGELSVQEEAELKSSVKRAKWKVAQGRVALMSLEEKVNSFHEGFKLIMEKTGVTSPEEMVEKFLKQEDENFRLFSHLNFLSEQIEELEDSVSSSKVELERYRGREEDDGKGLSVLQALDQRFEKFDLQNEQANRQIEEASSIIALVKQPVLSLYHAIGCTEDQPSGEELRESKRTSLREKMKTGARRELLENSKRKSNGENSMEKDSPSPNISDGDLVTYLSKIEQRVAEVSALYKLNVRKSFQETSEREERKRPRHAHPLSRLPSVDSDSEDPSDEEEIESSRPLSYKVLLSKIKEESSKADTNHSRDSRYQEDRIGDDISGKSAIKT